MKKIKLVDWVILSVLTVITIGLLASLIANFYIIDSKIILMFTTLGTSMAIYGFVASIIEMIRKF